MIEIFEYEKTAGLAEIIQESLSQSIYLEASCALSNKSQAEGSEIFIPPVLDGVSTDMALFYAVLVTATWNRNDDVFTPAECWAARNSPVWKPANRDHQKSESDKENKILGVIRESYPVNSKYEIVDSEDKLEHLVCGISLWERYWPTATADIKECVDDGTQYVSMECMFFGFGYALQLADGSGPIKLLERNKDTSKLTRFLRAFKGKGIVTIEGKEYRIGRWLKNVSFTGVGFVTKPANPESIVFNNYVSHTSASEASDPKFMTISEINLSKIEENSNNSVLSDSQPTKELTMAENKETVKVEENKIEAKPVADEALAAKATEAEKRCADLQAMVDSVRAEYNAYKTECSTKMDQMQKDYECMSESMRKKEALIANLEASISAMRRTAMANDRYSALASIDMTDVLEEKDEAKAKDKVANYTDAEWAIVLSMAQKICAAKTVSQAQASKSEETVKESKVDTTATEVAEVKEEKDTASSTAQAAAVAADNVAEAGVRDQLKSAFANKFGKNQKNSK